MKIIVLIAMALLLSGCLGLSVPDMEEFYEPPGDEKFLENIIINQIKCELRQGVDAALKDQLIYGNKIDWLLRDYGAKVTLKITANEKAGLSPGVTLNTIYPNVIKPFPVGGNVPVGQSFTMGLGGALSADTTRSESVGFTYDFKSLVNDVNVIDRCPNEEGIMVHSDLKIKDFVKNKVFLARVPGTTYPNGDDAPYNTFSYEATFVAGYGGSLNPTWKLFRVGATGSPFFNTSRTKTHYVTITLGPVAPRTKGRPPILLPTADQVHLASLIGQSVANAIVSQQR